MLRRLQTKLCWVAVPALALFAGCGDGAGGGNPDDVATFEVNPFWPQPLEYPQIVGPVSGVAMAPDGNVLILTRYDQAQFGGSADLNVERGFSSCCQYSQAVLEFAPDGSLVRQWGGPDQAYPWPASPRGIGIDPEGNVWIGGGPIAPPPAGPGGGPQGERLGRGGEEGWTTWIAEYRSGTAVRKGLRCEMCIGL